MKELLFKIAFVIFVASAELVFDQPDWWYGFAMMWVGIPVVDFFVNDV